jgi:hypothetical protein
MAKEDDEINLLDVFRNIFSSIGKFLKWLWVSFINNILLIIGLALLGIAGGVTHYFFAPPLYSSDLILTSNYLQNDMCLEIVDNLEGYVEDKTPEILARKLGIDVEDARKIKLIEYKNFNEKLSKKYEDTVVLGLPFRVSVMARDYKVFEKLQPALIAYFDKNPNVIIQKNLRQTNTKLVIEKLQREQIGLDSLKKVIAGHLVPRGPQTGFVFGQPLDPLNIYREAIKLYEEELDKNKDLLLTAQNIRVIRDFEVREKPYLPRKSISLTIGGFAGLILGFIIAYFRAIRKQIVK